MVSFSEPEPQILDFVTQQHKIFIAIATSQAFSLTATWLWDLYAKVNVDLAAGNTNDLPEVTIIIILKTVVVPVCKEFLGVLKECTEYAKKDLTYYLSLPRTDSAIPYLTRGLQQA